MAKRKKKQGAGRSASSVAADTNEISTTAAEGGPKGLIALALVLGLVLAGAAGITLHRRRDPARVWARTMEAAHATKIEQRLARCFGGNGDADAVRAVVNDVRRGNWGARFRECAGVRFAEVIAAPLDFLHDTADPPAAAEDAHSRERGRLERLRGALEHLERSNNGLDRAQPVPEDARDRLATALEDVAVEVQNEHQSMEDLANVADSAASWW